MRKTTFQIPKMDCPSEEQLIRMALEKTDSIRDLVFDLEARRLVIIHADDDARLLGLLEPLNFGATIGESVPFTGSLGKVDGPASGGEASVLGILLGINATMFVAEFAVGWVAESTGLIADSMDMFADAAVYGLSLFAVARSAARKKQAARLSGYLQALLAVAAMLEVGRRALLGSEPRSGLMMGTALVALVANAACMMLLYRHRQGGVHMRASWIFSTNDVIANMGVIAAGALVAATGSPLPDLVIGALISAVVMSGARRILKLSAA